METRVGKLPLRKEGTVAFSLVEVALAIGIASFSVLVLAALLPAGARTTRMAVDAMTEAQIVQYVSNELQLTSFANLSTWNNAQLYFDNQGLPTTSANPEQIYSVTLSVGSVNMSTNSAAPTPILFNSGPANTSTNAMLVQVNVVNRTVAGAGSTNIFPIVVPNAGF